MEARSTGAGLFACWRSALVLRLAGHPALSPLAGPPGYAPLFGPWLNVASRVGFALETLLAGAAGVGIDPAAEAAAALEEAALDGTASDGARLDGAAAGGGEPVWGESHTLLPVHLLPGPLAGTVPTLPLSGDTGCVLSTESLPGIEDRSFRGPVARYVWDLADRANSRSIVPFGAAGTPAHPHFADQLPLWAAGGLLPVATDWTLLTKEKE
ncbi:penicillin acylase family protein [Pseudarthrobacter sp. P1]|uniref:penicillin acylase family protein n=1 Tax=Pseudarthrobacter sp. P1 TaxID=3418418 RepID=UPI003CEC5453